MQVDWEGLWRELTAHFVLGANSIHGPEHWRRVERYGIYLAEKSEGNVLVVRLFAVFHDSCRLCDRRDDEHGPRAAVLAEQMRGLLFELTDDAFLQLQYACTWHTRARRHPDPTIGACWDADRLDIWRAGFTPQAEFMSTNAARDLVNAGHIGPEHVP